MILFLIYDFLVRFTEGALSFFFTRRNLPQEPTSVNYRTSGAPRI